MSGGLALGGGCAHGQGAGRAEGAASKKPLLKLGLMTYKLGMTWDVPTLIKNCTEAKFLHVELRTTHAHKVEVDLTPPQRREVRKRFEDSAIEAISLASAFSYHHADPATVRKNVEGTKEYTKLARDIGARGIRVFPNAFGGDEAERERTLERIGKAVRECAEFARDYGVEIRLSNHGKGTNRIPVTRKILDYADCPHVYVNWNCDGSDVEAPGFEANFNSVKDRIRNIHLHALYNEKYPYRRLFALLRENDYPGYCDAEIGSSEDPITVMKYYRATFLAMQNAL
jgi:sugar phosphate isomerase/epimerase